jgi:hypothetical protein
MAHDILCDTSWKKGAAINEFKIAYIYFTTDSNFGSGLLYDQLVMTSFLVMTNDHFFGHVKNKTAHAKKKIWSCRKKNWSC